MQEKGRSSGRLTGVALVVLSALCLILNAGVGRALLRGGIEPALLTTARDTLTFAVWLLVALVVRRSALRPPRGRLLLLVVALGVIGVAAQQWLYFVAIDRLPVSTALLLEYQAPILVALWARFVQRAPVRPRIWVGLVLAVVGLAAATEVWQGASLSTVGLAAGVGAAVTFAAYFVIGEAGTGSLDPFQVALWSFGAAAVVLNVFVPITGLGDLAGDGGLGRSVSLLGRLDGLSAPLWVLLGWVVLIGTLVPFGLFLLALPRVGATTVTMVAMLEPIGVAVLGWVWFRETLGPVAVLGCIAVVVGILIAQSARGRSDRGLSATAAAPRGSAAG